MSAENRQLVELPKGNIMQIAIYRQHTARAGHVCHDEELIERGSDDLVFFEGTKGELEWIAREHLAQPTVHAEDMYSRRVGAAILDELGLKKQSESRLVSGT